MSADTRLACIRCRRTLEYCSFCERSDCEVCVCYTCLAFELKESRKLPHDHGG